MEFFRKNVQSFILFSFLFLQVCFFMIQVCFFHRTVVIFFARRTSMVVPFPSSESIFIPYSGP